MRELKYNIKMLFSRPELYFSIIILQIVSLAQMFLAIRHTINLQMGNMPIFVEKAHAAEQLSLMTNSEVPFRIVLLLVFPVVCSLAFSGLHQEERINNMKVFFGFRRNNKLDLIIKYVLCFIIAYALCMFTVLMNYFILRAIFGSGVFTSNYGGGAILIKDFGHFLFKQYISNSTLYMIFIANHISILIGFLSCLSMTISFFVENKIVGYFSTVIAIVLLEIVCFITQINHLSIMHQLQVVTMYTIKDALLLYAVMIILIICLYFIYGYKKKRSEIIE